MKYYENFLGFRFGEYHSRDLGLYRVSDGDRYNDVSIPAFSDTTSKIPGGDGTYYWDSFYNQRTFTINTAFDSLSETQLRQIRQIFNGKAEDWLIFDETPYKKYRVKVQSPPQIKYHSFREDPVYDEEWNRTFERPRVYKGEIVFQFVSYYPYGIDNFKTVPFNAAIDSTTTSVNVHKGETFTGRMTVRDPYGTNITLPLPSDSSGIFIYMEDHPSLPPVGASDSMKTVYITNLKIYAQGSDGNYYEYLFGGKQNQRAKVTRQEDNTLQIQTTANTYLFGADSISLSYKKRSDKWDYVLYDENKYNKNPYHYYYKINDNIFVPAAGPKMSDDKLHVWIPNLKRDESVENSYKNADEWYDSTQLLSDVRMEQFLASGAISLDSGAGYFIYNPGDLPTDVKVTINSTAIPSAQGLDIVLKHRVQDAAVASDPILGRLHFKTIPSSAIPSTDKYVVVDTAKNLIYGVNGDGEQTGTLYNKYLTSGAFFKLPITQCPDINCATTTRMVDYCDYIWVNIPKPSDGSVNCSLEYNYLYY